MKIEETGIILSIKNLGENSALVKVLTENNGIYSGAVNSLHNKKAKQTFQIGNNIDVKWNARLSTHLGVIRAELNKSVSYKVIRNKYKLAALNSICNIISLCIPERVPEKELYRTLINFSELLVVDEEWHLHYLKLELLVLKEMGFGLDLTECAGTGVTNDLIYVSPKTGRAVSEQAGEPYKNKLLYLPQFLIGGEYNIDQFKLGLELSGYFLSKNLFEHSKRELPIVRKLLIEMLG